MKTAPAAPTLRHRRRGATVEARWNGAVIASSDDTVVVEGNHYFSVDAVDEAVLRPSETTSVCPWKGSARFCSLHVDGAENVDAAWYYPDPKPEAEAIRGGWRSGEASRSANGVRRAAAPRPRRPGCGHWRLASGSPTSVACS